MEGCGSGKVIRVPSFSLSGEILNWLGRVGFLQGHEMDDIVSLLAYGHVLVREHVLVTGGKSRKEDDPAREASYRVVTRLKPVSFGTAIQRK